MKQVGGFVLLVVVAIIVGVVALRSRGKESSGLPTSANGLTIARGFVGGEKLDFLRDPEVEKILAKKYKLKLEFDRRGSLEMATDPAAGDKDFLWPSSTFAAEVFKDQGKPMMGSEVIFNSPVVLYSWDKICGALAQRKLLVDEGALWLDDFPGLLALIERGATWKELGVPELYGKLAIYSTDPNFSNSGTMLAGLLANMMNGGEVVTDDSLPKIEAKLKVFFDRQGLMEQSSDAIFTQFLNRGMGDKPIIVGYEAQLLEYSKAHASEFQARREKIRMVYPRPTVWSSHPIIAITASGKRLIEAMKDPDIQRIAWEQHGFRSAIGAPNNPKAFEKMAVAASVDRVIPLPAARTMRKILDAIK